MERMEVDNFPTQVIILFPSWCSTVKADLRIGIAPLVTNNETVLDKTKVGYFFSKTCANKIAFKSNLSEPPCTARAHEQWKVFGTKWRAPPESGTPMGICFSDVAEFTP